MSDDAIEAGVDAGLRDQIRGRGLGAAPLSHRGLRLAQLALGILDLLA